MVIEKSGEEIVCVMGVEVMVRVCLGTIEPVHIVGFPFIGIR